MTTFAKMSDEGFATLLALFMCSDPWPLNTGRELVEGLLDDEARKRGWCDWLDAYNHLQIPN